MECSGLSVPITFESIEGKVQTVLQRGPKKEVQTTLDTAINFIMELERREASVARRSPQASDPAAGADYPKPQFLEAYKSLFGELTE